MGSGSDLLRMLEPALRPVPTAGAAGAAPATKSPAHLPIESRSFESLLEEARQMNLTSDGVPATVEPTNKGAQTPAPAGTPNLLASLTQLDRIENPALRNLLSGNVAQSGSTD